MKGRSTIQMRADATRRSDSIFLSASIPDPDRWKGDFDALEITDAVVALARVCLTDGVTIVTAAHPTIAPLVLYVAAEFPRELAAPPGVLVYQSRLFEAVLPEATRRFEEEGVGVLRWTPAARGDRPEPGHWNKSLEIMRKVMLKTTSPSAAAFIGGMEGILDEHALFRDRFPERPAYALGRPGGEARSLVNSSPAHLGDELMKGGSYPAVWRRVLEDAIG